ncbi:choline dehydrogenase, mitochondrial-like [Physella acuta]|uniref:choline dehydrogenase, mitochondrial-like n=1 Tax=Physella acuta TaxID=109671 RepID=UPI0027DBCA5F|nr:choline dehydrogenase, mitochondrial-like [Physella acuta]
MTTIKWAVFISLVQLSQQAIVDRFYPEYDYIIVGGGSAGCVLAGRLSEDAGVTVLLLEAGGNDAGNPNITIPGLAPLNVRTNVDWGYYTEPQPGVLGGFENKRSYWAMGKVLGGGSSINYMVWARGSRHDYNRWADYLGTTDWDYRHVLPYFKKSEDMLIPELRNSNYHSQKGPVPLSRFVNQPIVEKMIEAAQTIGYPFNLDYNGETTNGNLMVVLLLSLNSN